MSASKDGHPESPFITDCILDAVDEALQVREDIGVYKAQVFITTRTWSGKQIGRGVPTDVHELMRPFPGIKEFSHDLRVKEGGTIKAGDILLTSISMKSYSYTLVPLSVLERPGGGCKTGTCE